MTVVTRKFDSYVQASQALRLGRRIIPSLWWSVTNSGGGWSLVARHRDNGRSSEK